MKNPNTRWLYSALGSRICGSVPPPPPAGVPAEMLAALDSPLPVVCEGKLYPGAGLTGGRRRGIYGATWEILRPMGFSRPGRFEPFPGVHLFIPFVKGRTGAIPQGFSSRIPSMLRGFALAGKAAAAGVVGMRLLVVCARYNHEAWGLAAMGGAVVCTPDTLPQALSELDFPGNTE